jgi:hypothetical protein
MTTSNSSGGPIKCIYILEICSKTNSLEWALRSVENGQILISGDTDETIRFIVKNLALCNGDKGSSIFVTNDSSDLKSLKKFSVDEVVYVNLELRQILKDMLLMARCKLDICYTE